MIDFSKDVKISVCCPSYKRPYCITAHYIKDTKIYVDGSEYDEYVKANDGYGEVIKCADGIQGNLPRVRNYILDEEFKKGADIVVMMDDDVKAIGINRPDSSGYGYSKKYIGYNEFYDFIVYGSILCEEWGFGMWGLNRTMDHLFYQHNEPFYTTRPAVGQFMVFTKNELRFDVNLPLKEDYDMVVQQCNKYRGCLMLAFAFVDGDFGKLSGGTAVRRNHKREFEQFKLFKKKWGSKVVTGTNKAGHVNHKGERSKYIRGYDFSHPVVNIPIKGV